MNQAKANNVSLRSQLQTGTGAGADAYTGMVDCFKKIIRNEGYVAPCYSARTSYNGEREREKDPLLAHNLLDDSNCI